MGVAAARLLRAAAATPVASTIPSGAATTTTTILARVPPSAAAATPFSPLAAGARHAATPPVLSGATTFSPLAAGARHVATPCSLSGGSTTTTTTASMLLAAPATSILGRRAAFCPGILPRAANSTATISFPAIIPSHAAHSFSTLTAPEGLTPQVQKVLQDMEEASVAKHKELLKKMGEFEVEVIHKYSAEKLASAEKVLTAGKVAWRVSAALIFFGTGTLVTVLQVIKDGWKNEYHQDVKVLLDATIEDVKADLLAQLSKVVREEMQLIKAEKAVARK